MDELMIIWNDQKTFVEYIVPKILQQKNFKEKRTK